MDLVWGLALLLMDGYSRPLPFGKKEFLGGKINTPTIKTERLILLLQKKGIVLMRTYIKGFPLLRKGIM